MSESNRVSWNRILVAVSFAVGLGLIGFTVVIAPQLFTDASLFDEGASLAYVGIPFLVVGALLGWRRPSNPIGWLFQGWGLVMIFTAFVSAFTSTGRPGSRWLAWLVEVVWHPAFALLVFILLLFPHGTLPSPRWRKFAYLVPVVYALLALASATSPEAFELYNPGMEPPFPLPGGRVADVVFATLLFAQLALVMTAMVALVLRFRRAGGVERQQLKWFVYGVVMAVAIFVVGLIWLGAGYFFPAFGLIPIMAGVAIMRNNLFDIDRVVSRTVSYALVVGGLGLVFFGIVTALFTRLGVDNQLVVAGATLAVAALFNPLRLRVQSWVDRRFNRSRYDAQRVMDRFAASLQEGVDVDDVVEGWVGVVSSTMQPATAEVWIRD